MTCTILFRRVRSFPENQTVHVRRHAGVRRTVGSSGVLGAGRRLASRTVVDFRRAPRRVRARRVRDERRHENHAFVDRQHEFGSPGKLHVSRSESRGERVVHG